MTTAGKAARRRARCTKRAARQRGGGDEAVFTVVCGPDMYAEGRAEAVTKLRRLTSGRSVGAVSVRTFVGAEAAARLGLIAGSTGAPDGFAGQFDALRKLGEVAVLHVASVPVTR